jgi:hypothetical protein
MTYHEGSRAFGRMHKKEETPDTIAFFAYKVVFLFEKGKVFHFKADRLCAWEPVLSEKWISQVILYSTAPCHTGVPTLPAVVVVR